MHYKNYQKDLNTILESEIFGIALFGTAKKFAKQPQHQEKWQALEALEQQTLERLQAFLQEQQQTAKARVHIQFKGQVLGYALAKMPWRIAMYLIKDGTQPFMKTFARLSSHADHETREFFDYVMAHEQSIYDFAQQELKKKYGTSLAQVRALLA